MSANQAVIEVAANAAAETQAALESKDAVIEAVVENAAVQIEQAQEIAEATSRAAMETTLGDRINSVDERLNQCQRTMETQMASLAETLQATTTTLAEITGRLLAANSSSNPAPSPPEPEAPPPEAPPVVPEKKEKEDDLPEAEKPQRREKRRL